ncbi:MAG: hypothetical protein R2748_06815 [Bryobacterales bacterium]
MKIRLLTALLVSGIAAIAGFVFQPQLGTKGDLVLSEDFSHGATLDTKLWQSRQHTRWSIADGVLHGQPSTPEYQASRKDHQGLEPRLMIRTDLKDYAIEFRFRVNSGEQHMVGAFFEVGHHFARVAFKKSGLEMNIGDLKNPTILASKPEVKLETGKWYHVLAETRGDQTVVQFEGGPTLRGKDPRIAEHADGFGITGLRGGTIDVDDVKLWALAP